MSNKECRKEFEKWVKSIDKENWAVWVDKIAWEAYKAAWNTRAARERMI